MTILITGVAGFIGAAVSLALLSRGESIIGIDNLSHYYDVALKKNRLKILQQSEKFHFCFLDIIDCVSMEKLFTENQIEIVLHFAAQPGIRYSVKNPHAYIDANIVGFANLLESCRQNKIKHLIFASSSSVYGANTKLPFAETDRTDYPRSLYGATKKSNELMAYSYAHLYNLPCTGLRFFTVYGPWGRPDMALFSFTHDILNKKPIIVFNNGNMMRDFTYIDDVVEAVMRILNIIPEKNNDPPYQIYNIANHYPVQLKYLIKLLEKNLETKAKFDVQPMHAADMPNTYADVTAFEKIAGMLPHTPIEVGVTKFVKWYCNYYKIKISKTVEAT